MYHRLSVLAIDAKWRGLALPVVTGDNLHKFVLQVTKSGHIVVCEKKLVVLCVNPALKYGIYSRQMEYLSKQSLPRFDSK